MIKTNVICKLYIAKYSPDLEWPIRDMNLVSKNLDMVLMGVWTESYISCAHSHDSDLKINKSHK